MGQFGAAPSRELHARREVGFDSWFVTSDGQVLAKWEEEEGEVEAVAETGTPSRSRAGNSWTSQEENLLADLPGTNRFDMPPPQLAASSVEEIMLRRKATAALSAFRPETMRQKQPPAPEPIWASAHLQRALSAPGLRAPRPRPRSSPFAPQYTEAVAFGKRATLPNMATPSPVANASSVEYFAMSRPPSAFLAMSQPAGARSARTAPSPGGMTPIDHAITPMGSAHLPSQGGGVHTPAAGAGRRASTAVPGSRPGRGSVASPAFGDGSRGVDMGAGAAGAATCACAGAFEVGAVGGLIAPNFVGLSDEVDEISERLAQVERVTSMMTSDDL